LHIPFIAETAAPQLFNWSTGTFFLFWITLGTQVAFCLTIPPIASREYNFFIALRYFDALRSFNRTAGSEIYGRIRLLNEGMNAYNKFLKRYLGLQIKDIGRIRSKIIADADTDVKKGVESLIEGFAKYESLIAPVKCISKFLGNEDADELLIKISVLDKLKRYSFLYGPIVGVLVTIIPLIF
jgi:hypothetical protein